MAPRLKAGRQRALARVNKLLLLLVLLPAAALASVTRHVDPFIGTDGTGHVTPAAMVPFGMVAPGPDNADRGWSYSSGYQYRAPRILGFSNTHISGAGIPELGDVLLMPAAGRRWHAASTDFSAAPDKKTESAHPGVYRVSLPSHGVRVELTATQRVAVHRYTFTQPGAVQVLVDLQHGLSFVDGPRVTRAESQVDAAQGEVTGTTQSKNWVEREASFIVRFDRPVQRVTTLPPREGEKAARYLLDFDLGTQRVLHARVALSTVDVAGARRNLDTDAIAARGFDPVRAAADAQWQRLLARIQIEPEGSPSAQARQQRIFYSALYRTLLHPSDIADADGRVRGPRGEVMQARGGTYYSTLSLWDTFRAVHPLLTLLVPERVDGIVSTLLDHHRQQGYLPLWTAWGRETHTMIGNPALPVIADALAKGFATAQRDEALQAMVETSTRARPDAPAWAQREWATYEQLGYLPYDWPAGEAVSKTLEYGIGDDAVARVAALLGQTDTAQRFARRAQGWRQLLDQQTLTSRGKNAAGQWRVPFDPVKPTSPLGNPGDYTEANAWQYTATPALHDAPGFRDALGGPQGLERWLDQFFTLPVPNPDKHLGQEAMIGQLAHGNEPSHHISWLYAFTDAPHKGHALVRRIANDFYSDQPGGIVGNDDCGQMSAWYVFGTLGLYPVMPASGSYVTGLPLVRSATLALAGGKTLRIQRVATDSAQFNGQGFKRTALTHATLLQGGTLLLGMAGEKP